METKTSDFEKYKLKTGTTTVGVKCRDGIVLAADTQSSNYMVAQKDSLKIKKIWDHIGLTQAGSVGDILLLVKFLQNKARSYNIENDELINPKRLATYMSTILNQYRWYPFNVGFILGSYYEGNSVLLSLDEIGSLIEEKDYSFTGSGSYMAVAVLEDLYTDSNISTAEGLEIAVKAVRAARERDIYSGGNTINAAIIDKKGFSYVDNTKIKKICEPYKYSTFKV